MIKLTVYYISIIKFLGYTIFGSNNYFLLSLNWCISKPKPMDITLNLFIFECGVQMSLINLDELVPYDL